MATSPNFSWPEPDNTDLVKNGALAIRTAVDAIDSSLVDLKGGTSGQVLAKASNTDMDFSWVAQDDSNAIQNSIVDAKGDLIAATANDTPARLAVGNNGETLVADSSTSTGLAWEGAITCAAISTTVFTIANATFTTLAFNSELWDTDAMHSTSTNTSRITVPKTGYYKIELQGIWQSNNNANRGARILKNGSTFYTQFQEAQNLGDLNYYYPYTMQLTAGDYIEVQMYQDSGTTLVWYNRGQDGMFLVTWIGA